MSGNNAFELVEERGWRRGFGNMLGSEFSRWWKTRMWWMQCLIWTATVCFILGAILFSSPDASPGEDAATLYGVFATLFPAVGVIIIMQGVVVGEKSDGTAAWVLSKPITRPAFILSKVIANGLGVLVTMVVVPGTFAYILKAAAPGKPWDPAGFLTALGVIFIFIFFFLCLTLMLGSFFTGRGPVIGIALALLFMQQYLVAMLPLLRYVLPWNLSMPIGEQVDAAVPNLLMGLNIYSIIPAVVVALEGILFIVIGLVRFNREEF